MSNLQEATFRSVGERPQEILTHKLALGRQHSHLEFYANLIGGLKAKTYLKDVENISF